MRNKAEDLKKIDEVIAAGPFAASWESLEEYQIPRWYKDEKFGIFIHWGAYCVPAFGNEWYPRRMYVKDDACFEHHRQAWGDQAELGYKDFIPKFKAEQYDPGAWADLFANAGARFVVPVAEHHDGFAMYECGYSEWCSTQMGPKRDVTGELAAAVRDRGMIFGLSSHRAEHWWFFHDGTQFESDVKEGKWPELYGPAQPKDTQPDQEFLEDWLLRTCEPIDKYEPKIVWFDWWIEEPAFAPYLRKLAAYYYNRGAQWDRGVAINYKNRAYPMEAAVFDVERGQLSDVRPLLWQTDTSVSKNSWGYIENHDYKATSAIIHDLVDIVSKNGALLLNIGPKPDGTIPEPEQQMLLEIGRWLEVNGEAIYGTRPWKVFGEGPTEVVEGSFGDTKREAFTGEDLRFTRTESALYATALGWPDDGKLTIRTLAEKAVNRPLTIGSITLLGSDAQLQWAQDAEALTVELPAEKPCEHAFVLKIE